MDERQTELLRLLPLKPDADFATWVRSHPSMTINVLVYKMAYVRTFGYTYAREKMAQCNCSACGGTFYQPITYNTVNATWKKWGKEFGFLDDHGDPCGTHDCILCPNCGEQVTVRHSSELQSGGTVLTAIFPCQFLVLEGNPAIVCWHCMLIADKLANVRVQIAPYEVYAFHDKKCYRYSEWRSGIYGRVYHVGLYEPRARCDDYFGEEEKAFIYPYPKYPGNIFDGTCLENAHIDRYLKDSEKRCFPITYLRTFQKHPQVENLIMQGMTEYVNQAIYACGKRRSYYYSSSPDKFVIPEHYIEWKGHKKPTALLGLDRTELRYFQTHGLHIDMLEAYKSIRAAGWRRPVYEYTKSRGMTADQAVELAKSGYDPEKVQRYLDRQNRRYEKKAVRADCCHVVMKEADASILIDYLKIAKDIKRNLNTKDEIWPPDLFRAHDALQAVQTERRAEKKKKEQRKMLEANAGSFRQLADRYAWMAYEKNGLYIRIAEKPDELIDEGTALSHCVGGYVISHRDGKRCIFFLRQAAEPKKPYYTLELNMETLTVIQNRGYKNCARTPEIEAFEREWVEHIRTLAQEMQTKERRTA